MMGEGEIFQALRDALWTAVMMALPVLSVALVVGFVIGLLQALTSIQEMTLTFLPKVAAVVIVFLLSMGFMTRLCLDLFETTVLPFISR